jgi:DNA-binding NarL/FixJ family response regulator
MPNNQAITRPKVLIVTPHPIIGAGIETVLRLEDLYDVRRAGGLTDAAAAAAAWPADAALVDGVLLDSGQSLDLGVPCVILSGDPESGERLMLRAPAAKAWLLKDAPPDKLVGAIDRSLGIARVRSDVRGTLGLIVAVVIVIGFVAALALFVWRFFLS